MAANTTSTTQPFLAFPVTQGYGQTSWSSEPTVGELGSSIPETGLPSLDNFHTGIDYAAPQGTPIYAFTSGTITKAGWDTTGFGNSITENTGVNGLSTLFGHLNSIAVKAGQTVQAGQLIGYSGSTGNSTGPHVHLSVINAQGLYINPVPVIGELTSDMSGKIGVTTTPDQTAAQKIAASGQAQTQGIGAAQAQTSPGAATNLDFTGSIGHVALQIGLFLLALVLIVLGVVILLRKPEAKAAVTAAKVAAV